MTVSHLGKLLRTTLVLASLSATLGFSQSRVGVSLSFDHVSPALPSNGSDPALLFLRIRNNSRTSIQVLATAPQTGAKGVELVHEIVEAGHAGPVSGWISPPEHYSPINEATALQIQPYTDLLFSVPLNHLGPSWRLRIVFESVIPEARPGRRPQGAVDFTWADIPAKERRAWKRDSGK